MASKKLFMNPPEQDSCRNLIIRSMEPGDFAVLAPHLTRAPLELNRVLASPGQPISTVCFPEHGIITFSDVVNGGDRIGIAHTGYEGYAGWHVLLGCDVSPYEARVTARSGTALFIEPDALVGACRSSETLRSLLLRFVQAFLTQLGRTAVSNLIQPVEMRLCRWTLMAHDRTEGDDIVVTHEEIAVMLGVRRASVTDALHILEGERLIRARRGCVTVLDREGLQRHAGDSYGFFEAEYSRLIAPFPGTGMPAAEGAMPIRANRRAAAND